MLKITKNKATSIYTPKDHCIVSFDYEERDFSFGYTSDKWKTCTGYSFNKLNENRPVVLPRITEIERDELIKAGFKEIKINNMNNWQQQFDEEFVMFNGQYIEPEFRDKSDVGPVKNFITTLLEKQREDIVEKIEKEFKLIDFSGTTRNNIIKLIEEKT